MRILALDVGLRRIGVAISDPTGTLARTLAVVRRDGNIWTRIAQWVSDEEVGSIVVGYPLLFDGSKGSQARDVEAFVGELEQHVSAPIHLWDESLSTARAQQIMIESGRRRQDRKKHIDAVAAAVILQEFLDARPAKE